jgi:hypothetical protein
MANVQLVQSSCSLATWDVYNISSLCRPFWHEGNKYHLLVKPMGRELARRLTKLNYCQKGWVPMYIFGSEKKISRSMK